VEFFWCYNSSPKGSRKQTWNFWLAPSNGI
jgi:hypothetical protein